MPLKQGRGKPTFIKKIEIRHSHLLLWIGKDMKYTTQIQSLFQNMNLCEIWPKDFKSLICKWKNIMYKHRGVFWNENSKLTRNAETFKQKHECL